MAHCLQLHLSCPLVGTMVAIAHGMPTVGMVLELASVVPTVGMGCAYGRAYA